MKKVAEVDRNYSIIVCTFILITAFNCRSLHRRQIKPKQIPFYLILKTRKSLWENEACNVPITFLPTNPRTVSGEKAILSDTHTHTFACSMFLRAKRDGNSTLPFREAENSGNAYVRTYVRASEQSGSSRADFFALPRPETRKSVSLRAR